MTYWAAFAAKKSHSSNLLSILQTSNTKLTVQFIAHSLIIEVNYNICFFLEHSLEYFLNSSVSVWSSTPRHMPGKDGGLIFSSLGV